MTAVELDPDGYPSRYMTCGERAVWLLGEDGEAGLMIEGHGPGALAALDAYRQAAAAERCAAVPDDLAPRELWAVFAATCGCTDAEHDAHVDEWGDCHHPCAHPGLPPCHPVDDVYGFEWGVTRVEPSTPGALPVTEVEW